MGRMCCDVEKGNNGKKKKNKRTTVNEKYSPQSADPFAAPE